MHLSVTPPPQMPATMEAGTIQGYCVGEPWNQQAVFMGIGVPVITDYEIWPNNPEKVFGVTRQWAEDYPNTHLRLLRAMIRAAHWLDENNNANRDEAVKILARPSYVGADEAVIANSMTGTFEYEKVTSARSRISMSSSGITPPTRIRPMPSGISPRCAAGARSPRPSRTTGIWKPQPGFTGPTSTSRRPVH